MTASLESQIKEYAHRLGFSLVGITTAEPPPHFPAYERWLEMGRQASMAYLSDDRARAKRAEPKLILPECQSIIVLGLRYANPKLATENENKNPLPGQVNGRVAAYAWGTDYHLVMPEKLKALVAFIETQTGQTIPNRWYTDTGPVLERDLAMRAGLGWIGKNTCLINPQHGSYFLLAEILLAFPLEPDIPFEADRCGSCTRCIDACPTNCILPDRTLDASRCISFLTIENKTEIPENLRPAIDNWVFGCDICQTVCPWNERFAALEGDPSLAPRSGAPTPDLAVELSLSPEEFNKKFKDSPIKRAKRNGYLRNVAVALGNIGDKYSLPMLETSSQVQVPMVKEHIAWAIDKIREKKVKGMTKLLIATENKGKRRELQELLFDIPGIELMLPSELGINLKVEETGSTYAENAALKAKAYCAASGEITLADDSGLEVYALDGAPGIYSARYSSKPGATDSDRRTFLLENLRDKPRPWLAHFHAAIAVAVPGDEIRIAEGDCPGEIIPEERGANGFGYDPIFLLQERGLTMAELSQDEKNRLSHRAQAVMNAESILKEILGI